MKNEAILARLDALETQVAELQAGQVKPAKRTASAAAVPAYEGATISYPAPVSSFVMPSIVELQKLLAIVQRDCPQLAPDFHDEQLEFFAGFSRAFAYIGSLGRTDELNNKISISWWCDACREWLRQSNITGDILASGFAAACLAQNVDHLSKDPAAGTVWTFALKPHGGGRENGSGWRSVLAAGQIRSPRSLGQAPRRAPSISESHPGGE